jgi:chemotaxis protein methyltransferase CheR
MSPPLLTVATDISTEILQKAVAGIYKMESMKDIPPGTVSAHFSKVIVDNAHCYEAKDHLKDLITYRRFNLMTEKFPFKYPFDFIFCRNVMIYFDPETQHRLVSKFYDCLPKNGYLFIGHSETLSKSKSSFNYTQPAVYQK